MLHPIYDHTEKCKASSILLHWQSNKTQADSTFQPARRSAGGKLETNIQMYGNPGCAEDGLLPCRRMQEGSNPSIPYRTDVLGALPGSDSVARHQ